MLQNPPRRADDNMGAIFQRTQLRPKGHAATQGEQLNVWDNARQSAYLFAYLVSKFPGRA